MAVRDKRKDLRRSAPSTIRSLYESSNLQMTATFGTEAPFNFCNRSSVIWYTSGKPTASQDSPFISLTSPGAAVKVRAIPLLQINPCYTLEGVRRLTVHDAQHISIDQVFQEAPLQKACHQHSILLYHSSCTGCLRWVRMWCDSTPGSYS